MSCFTSSAEFGAGLGVGVFLGVDEALEIERIGSHTTTTIVDRIHSSQMRYVLFLFLAAASFAQSVDQRLYSEMHWRSIGPPRAGRARALAGVPSQPNVVY